MKNPSESQTKEEESVDKRIASDAVFIEGGASSKRNTKSDQFELELTQSQKEDIYKSEDREVVLKKIKKDPVCMSRGQGVGDELRENKEFALEAIRITEGEVLPYLFHRFFENPKFILEAVKLCGMTLKYCWDKYKADKEIVLAAVKQNKKVFQFVSKDLQKDPDVRKAAGMK